MRPIDQPRNMELPYASSLPPIVSVACTACPPADGRVLVRARCPDQCLDDGQNVGLSKAPRFAKGRVSLCFHTVVPETTGPCRSSAAPPRTPRATSGTTPAGPQQATPAVARVGCARPRPISPRRLVIPAQPARTPRPQSSRKLTITVPTFLIDSRSGGQDRYRPENRSAGGCAPAAAPGMRWGDTDKRQAESTVHPRLRPTQS